MPVLSIEKVPEDGHAPGRYVPNDFDRISVRSSRSLPLEAIEGIPSKRSDARVKIEQRLRIARTAAHRRPSVRSKFNEAETFLFICWGFSRHRTSGSGCERSSILGTLVVLTRDKCAYLYPDAFSIRSRSSSSPSAFGQRVDTDLFVLPSPFLSSARRDRTVSSTRLHVFHLFSRFFSLSLFRTFRPIRRIKEKRVDRDRTIRPIAAAITKTPERFPRLSLSEILLFFFSPTCSFTWR